MRLIEDVANSHYDLAVSVQLVGKHARNLSQGEYWKAVAAEFHERKNGASTNSRSRKTVADSVVL